MALVHIFNAVAADALMSGVTAHYGSQGLDLEDSPPKLVWIPKDITFAAKRVQGTGIQAMSMMTRVQQAEVHVWASAAPGDLTEGGPFLATELLLDRVLWAIRNAVGPATFNLISARWTDDSVDHLGREVVLLVSFDLPVVLQPTDDPTTTAILTHVVPTTNPATSSMTETLALPHGDLTRTPVL